MNKKQIKKAQTGYEGLEKSNIESSAVIKEVTHALDFYSKEADPANAEEHRSYVYALCQRKGESLIPFYIGEGKGARVWSHELEEDEQKKILKEEFENDESLKELTDDEKSRVFEERVEQLHKKIQKINDIKEHGGEVVKYIIKWGMTSKEAFMAESALINLLQIGGLKFDSSCAENKNELTNIVKGHMSKGEKQVGSTAAITVEQFHDEFAKEPLYFEELQRKKVKALLVNINSGYRLYQKFHSNSVDRETAIRDTACGNWKLKEIEELEKSGIEYVFATVEARVVGIYKIKEVNGKKFHNMYESAYENSEYPHGEGTVPFRNSDYENAQTIVKVANSKGKEPSQVALDDMPSDYRKHFIEKNKQKDSYNAFKNLLERKYMILEDIPEDDPNYSDFMEYLHRRIIHTDKYVEITKDERQKAREKAIKAGKTEKLPNPDKVTNNIYGSGNPLKFIRGKIKE